MDAVGVPVVERRWRFTPHDADRVGRLQRSGLPPVVAQLLAARGLNEPDEARRFLEAKLSDLHDPETLPGARDAARRLHAAVKERRKIVVYGDYDADGMTGASLLMKAIALVGGDVAVHIPNRLEEGYGLSAEALETLARRGASLVVSVDCGIASVDEARRARELGLELLVTDHHEMKDELPPADVLVHPRLPGSNYPWPHLCGAAVALKVAWALCQEASGAKRVEQGLREFLLSAMSLAALGTVADVVPLLGENRVIVRHGLKSMKERPSLGLAALMRVAKLAEKPSLSSEDIGYFLAPRLNAAGRLGQAALGVELLTTTSAEKAEQLALYLDQLNEQRDSIERSIQLAASKQLKEQFDVERDPAFVLAGRGWHHGVIGIVAGRLAEKLHRPVVIIGLDEAGVKPGAGSARSAGSFELHRALAACGNRLLSHGGHAAAAGLRIEERHVDAFRQEFLEYVATEFPPEQRVPTLRVDAEAPFVQLTLDTVASVETLGPFGNSNPRPVLAASGAVVRQAKRMGAAERHLSVTLDHLGTVLRGVAFGHGEWAEPLLKLGRPIDVAYRPVINEFRGRRSVEVQLVDWRPTES